MYVVLYKKDWHQAWAAAASEGSDISIFIVGNMLQTQTFGTGVVTQARIWGNPDVVRPTVNFGALSPDANLAVWDTAYHIYITK